MINKNKFNIKNTKKVLHKVGKQWVTVSVATLALLGVGAVANTATHSGINMPKVSASIVKSKVNFVNGNKDGSAIKSPYTPYTARATRSGQIESVPSPINYHFSTGKYNEPVLVDGSSLPPSNVYHDTNNIEYKDVNNSSNTYTVHKVPSYRDPSSTLHGHFNDEPTFKGANAKSAIDGNLHNIPSSTAGSLPNRHPYKLAPHADEQNFVATGGTLIVNVLPANVQSPTLVVQPTVTDTVQFKHGNTIVKSEPKKGTLHTSFDVAGDVPSPYNVHSNTVFTYNGGTHVVNVSDDGTVVQPNITDTIQFKHGNDIVKQESKTGKVNTGFNVDSDVPSQYNEHTNTAFTYDGGTHVVYVNNKGAVVQPNITDAILFKHGNTLVKAESQTGKVNTSFNVVSDVPSPYNVHSNTVFTHNGGTHVVYLGIKRPNGNKPAPTPTPIPMPNPIPNPNGSSTSPIIINNYYNTTNNNCKKCCNNGSNSDSGFIPNGKPGKPGKPGKVINITNVDQLGIGQSGNYHGYKITRLNVPAHFRWIYIVKTCLAHKDLVNYGDHKYWAVLRPNHRITLRINKLFKTQRGNKTYYNYEVRIGGHNAFVTSYSTYTRNAYYQPSDLKNAGRSGNYYKARLVLNNGVYDSRYYTGRTFVRELRRGKIVHIKRLITIGRKGDFQTRFQLTNGDYITSNKNWIKLL